VSILIGVVLQNSRDGQHALILVEFEDVLLPILLNVKVKVGHLALKGYLFIHIIKGPRILD